MKSLILLFLLLPLTVLAKFYQGSITFTNGLTKKGYIEIPYYDDSKIKFRIEENNDTEKYSLDEVIGFEIINDEKEKISFTNIILSSPKLFGKDHIKIDTKKSWVRIIKEGKITVFAADYYERSGDCFISGLRFYVKKTNENFARFIRDKPNRGIIINEYSVIIHYLKYYFKDECPKFIKALDSDDIKQNGMGRIVDIYDQHCGE